mmetsp:Transcript_70637/g.229476  ORF Transcript_70637/g.229476 Transcript_70637/m.229476 type:complete len:210 (-) Transcript_70637:341-970(-)
MLRARAGWQEASGLPLLLHYCLPRPQRTVAVVAVAAAEACNGMRPRPLRLRWSNLQKTRTRCSESPVSFSMCLHFQRTNLLWWFGSMVWETRARVGATPRQRSTPWGSPSSTSSSPRLHYAALPTAAAARDPLPLGTRWRPWTRMRSRQCRARPVGSKRLLSMCLTSWSRTFEEAWTLRGSSWQAILKVRAWRWRLPVGRHGLWVVCSC